MLRWKRSRSSARRLEMSPAEESTVRGIYEQLRTISKCLDDAPPGSRSLVYSIEGCVEEALLLCEELVKDY